MINENKEINDNRFQILKFDKKNIKILKTL